MMYTKEMLNGLAKCWTLVFIVALCVMPKHCYAKTVRQLWLGMPQSVVPYLDANMRMQCADFYDMHSGTSTDNQLGGKTRIDTLTTEYLSATLSDASDIQMRLLPVAGSPDSLLCVVRSWIAPERESEVRLYNQDWQPVGNSITFSLSQFVSRPDTMTEARFSYLLSCLDPVMYSATLSVVDQSLSVEVSAVVACPEDKEALNAVLVQRKFNWDGIKFK